MSSEMKNDPYITRRDTRISSIGRVANDDSAGNDDSWRAGYYFFMT